MDPASRSPAPCSGALGGQHIPLESRKGKASIQYLGLARAELLQMRARHRRTVIAAIRHTIAALEEGRDPGTDLDDLLTLLSSKEAYVAYTRTLVRTHMSAYIVALGL